MDIDEDIRGFLIRIVQSVSMVILWMLLNMFFGIYLDLAFFDSKPDTSNYIFYVCFLISLVMLIAYLKKKWRKS